MSQRYPRVFARVTQRSGYMAQAYIPALNGGETLARFLLRRYYLEDNSLLVPSTGSVVSIQRKPIVKRVRMGLAPGVPDSSDVGACADDLINLNEVLRRSLAAVPSLPLLSRA